MGKIDNYDYYCQLYAGKNWTSLKDKIVRVRLTFIQVQGKRPTHSDERIVSMKFCMHNSQ